MRALSEINLADRDRHSILESVSVLKGNFPVVKVILFGSKAKGTSDEESDIDLLVLTKRHLGWVDRKALTDALFEVELKYDVVISALVVSVDEWENGYWRVLPIKDEIESHGVAA